VTRDTVVDLMKAAKDLATRNQVSTEEAEQRLAACFQCPAWTGSRCRECGCFMKTKVTLKNSKCPLNRWPELIAHPTINDTGHSESDE